MIVVGTMDWPKTLESGQFFCPVCESAQSYRRRVSRPFLTVYFIPVFPIGGLQEYVECRNCRTSFEPSMVGDEPNASEHSFSDDLKVVIALTMLEDNRVTEAEIARGLLACQVIGQTQVSRDQLGETCSALRTRQLRLGGYLWTARKRWNREERLQMVKAIFIVASAEGSISPSRMKALILAQRILELDEVEIRNSIAEAEMLNLNES